VAVYAALREELPARVPAHSVVLPSDPSALYASLEAGEEPEETMAFVNYYRAGEVYPNDGGTLAVLLTAPATGGNTGLEEPFVEREIARVSRAVGLPGPATYYVGEHEVLHPRYFGAWGSAGGALTGRRALLAERSAAPSAVLGGQTDLACGGSGPSVPSGGGIRRAGGAMISTGRLLRSLVK
jgi:phytoene desaturase